MEKHRGGQYWVVAVVIFFLLVACRFPSLVLHPEPWAESVTNYLDFALNTTGLDYWFITDAGYYVFLPRLIAKILVGGLGIVDDFPFAASAAGVLIVGIYCAVIFDSRFRKIIPSLPVLSLLFLSFASHYGYGMYVFHNFSYFAVVLGLVYPFLLLGEEGKVDSLKFAKFIFLGLIVGFAIAAKSYGIVFLPFYLLLFCSFLVQRKVLAGLSTIFPLVPLCFQIFSLANTMHTPPGGHGVALFTQKLFVVMETWLAFLIHGASYLIASPKGVFESLVIGICIWIFVFYSILSLWKARKYHPALFILFCLCIGAASELITSAVFYYEPLKLFDLPSFVDDSHHFYFFTSLLLAMGTAFVHCDFFGKGKLLIVAPSLVMLMILAFSGVFGFFLSTSERQLDPGSDFANNPSQWKIYKNLLHRDWYCIPVNPYGFFLTHACEVLDENKWKGKGVATRVQGILIDSKKLEKISLPDKVTFEANVNGHAVPIATQRLTPEENRYQYFLLPEEPKLSGPLGVAEANSSARVFLPHDSYLIMRQVEDYH